MYANVGGRCWLLTTTAVMLALAGWTRVSMAQEQKPEAPKPKDIVAVANEQSNLKTFCKLLESAGLTETLKGKGPYTVFAPTDEAFKKLGKQLDELQKPEKKAELQRILKHHVLDGRKTAADVKNLKFAKTLAGDRVTIVVKDDVVMVDTAKVTKADTEASNGLIHVVDIVLMPAAEQP
jgi:uncharacterized surface protein with fasciclin (FAS1) repeats